MYALARNGENHKNIEKIVIKAIFPYIFQPRCFKVQGENSNTEKQQNTECEVSCNYNRNFSKQKNIAQVIYAKKYNG